MNETGELPWLAGLNPVQKEAAAYDGGPLLIVAGAGSGKTRVIVHRIAHLLRGRNADPGSILAVTFTNKAAEEMQQRVARLLGLDSAGIWVSTFHSFGARVLRSHIEKIGYSKHFVIFDDADQASLLKKVLKEQGYDPKHLTPKTMRAFVDRVKREALTLQDLENSDDPRTRKFLPLLRVYQDRLREANAVDFNDLLLLTYHLFERHPETLREYQERFKHILVDEYQDTNRVQYLLVRQLAGATDDVCVVGDEDQSIYGWRGADISNILNFERDFKNARVIMLEQNYRSACNIIEAASELIAANRERKPKKLWSDNPPGEPIRLHQAFDERDEARWVIEEVLRLKGRGKSLNEMAVFYRTHAQSRLLEDELRSLNVSYNIYGGPRFYERREVKDALAYLRFLVNPADEVSLRRIINQPARGIGNKTLELIEQERRRLEGDWIAAMKTVIENRMAAARSLKGIAEFAALVEKLTPLLVGSTAALLEAVIKESGYRKALEAEGGVEAMTRLENLEELVNAGADYDREAEDPSPAGFLEKVTLATDMDRFDPEAGALTLMTLHSAKGLEFPVVFMVGMEDGVFPHARALFDEDRAGSALEEERRLCYVGMTRAKEILHLAWAAVRSREGCRRHSEPSQFLAEIPARFVNQSGKRGSGLRTPQRKAKPGSGRKPGPVRRDFGDSEIVYDEPEPAGTCETPEGEVFRPGDRVVHRDYGEGLIKRFEESGDKLKVVVKFARGTKKFLARYAPLKPA